MGSTPNHLTTAPPNHQTRKRELACRAGMGRGCESQAGQLGGLRPRRGEPAASYSRAGGSRTTLGEEALDFRVRDGNGYDCPSVATGKGDELEAKEDCSAREAGTESRFMMKLEK